MKNYADWLLFKEKTTYRDPFKVFCFELATEVGTVIAKGKKAFDEANLIDQNNVKLIRKIGESEELSEEEIDCVLEEYSMTTLK